MSIEHFLLIFGVTTFSATYGLIFGGGSFLVLPTLFLLGVDPKIAVATNISAAIAQVGTGAIVFYRHKKVHFPVVKWTMPFFFVGAIVGAFVLIEMDTTIIKKLIALMIIIFAVVSLFKREKFLEKDRKVSKNRKKLGSFLFFLFGIYQIAITAGAGTVNAFLLIYAFGLKLKTAIYTKHFIAAPAFLVGIGILIANGLVDWMLFIPLILGRAIGAFISTRIILHSKSKPLAIAFSIIVILLALRVLLG